MHSQIILMNCVLVYRHICLNTPLQWAGIVVGGFKYKDKWTYLFLNMFVSFGCKIIVRVLHKRYEMKDYFTTEAAEWIFMKFNVGVNWSLYKKRRGKAAV
jgi:hypothetical protein